MIPYNLKVTFKKAGIYPFDSTVISSAQVAPAVIFTQSEEQDQGDISNSISNQGTADENSTAEIQSSQFVHEVQLFQDAYEIHPLKLFIKKNQSKSK